MDSEESRPGSSASSSSSNSSNNSRPSSQPDGENNAEGPRSPMENTVGSPQMNTDRKSRSRSRSSNENFVSQRSGSKSNSGSSDSASSSENENEDATSQPKSKASSVRSSSEEGSLRNQQRDDSRQQSVSPVNSHRSSRHSSSSSSNRSQSNSHADRDAAEADINISHEDLSDVSDMESEKRIPSANNSKQSVEDDAMDTPHDAVSAQSDKEHNQFQEPPGNDNGAISDLRYKLDKMKGYKASERDISPSNGGYATTENGNSNCGASKPLHDLDKGDDEDALDFEAEEGECLEVSKEEEKENPERNMESVKKVLAVKSDGEAEDGEELEEGEVSDEDEKRPEESEPKPVCRFYTRGQCTWGMSCRFLHPGVTDKGNYTMFDLVRPVPVSHSGASSSRPAYPADYQDYRTERPSLHHRAALHHAPAAAYASHHDPRALLPETPVVVESAWERGLRTAKEMMRKANKRKEQDMDFEDKKMNLTISPEELEKDAYYLKERSSPQKVVTIPVPVPVTYGRHNMYHDAPSGMYSPPDRFGRGPPLPPYDEIDPYGRSTRYRELPPHRMPQYEDERRVRPTREVIVQRVEPIGRGDEWNDPWMRSKSPMGRGSHERSDKRRRDRRSYSSNSSYSSSTSSQSDSSSDSSRSPSPADHRRRYNNSSQKSPPPVRRHGIHSARSPSPPIRRGNRRSPVLRRSPLPKRRGQFSPSPAIDKRLPYSPVHKRKRLSPTTKKPHDRSKVRRRHTSSSSGTDSSDSSASDSDSESGSSSSDSSSKSRGKSARHGARSTLDKAPMDRKTQRKIEPPKKRSPISIEIKKQTTVGASALTSPTHSASSEKETKKSRREELLKQLRAVEDAIAKKRQKLT